MQMRTLGKTRPLAVPAVQSRPLIESKFAAELAAMPVPSAPQDIDLNIPNKDEEFIVMLIAIHES